MHDENLFLETQILHRHLKRHFTLRAQSYGGQKLNYNSMIQIYSNIADLATNDVWSVLPASYFLRSGQIDPTAHTKCCNDTRTSIRLNIVPFATSVLHGPEPSYQSEAKGRVRPEHEQIEAV